MQFICSKKNPVLPLTDYVSIGDPLLISIETFIGYLKINLQAVEGQNFRITGSRLARPDSDFSIPFYGESFKSVPSSTFFVITHDQFGYTVLFCLSHKDLESYLEADEDGLHLVLRSGASRDAKQTRTPLICLRGYDLKALLDETLQLALKITGNHGRMASFKSQLPSWLDYLGWDSGVALGLDINHEKIISAVKSLLSQGVPIKYVMIDEGWQQLALNGKDEERKWAMLDFEADKERFNRGLKGLVVDLQALGIHKVGIWHGIMGYRGGIHPFLAKQYDLPPDRYGRYYLGSDLGRTFQFFYDYYAYLKEQGINFVKIGDQNAVSQFDKPQINATALYKNLQAAIQAAANIQFNQPTINTECLRNENLFYWSTSPIARSASTTDWKHPMGLMRSLRNHLTNCLWLQFLMQPDIGGWITHGLLSEHLAIFHAFSGVCHVIGDLPGKHNKRLLQKLILASGIILKPDEPLTLCQQSLFVDPVHDTKVYKAYTFKGKAGIIVAFNVINDKNSVNESVSPLDIPDLKGDTFALFSYRNGFLGLVDKLEYFDVVLTPSMSDIYTFVPVEKGIAVWGCSSYYLAPAPITEVQHEEEVLNIRCLEGSPIMLYCEREVLEVRRNGEVIPWEHDFKLRTLKIDSKLLKTTEPCYYSITFE